MRRLALYRPGSSSAYSVLAGGCRALDIVGTVTGRRYVPSRGHCFGNFGRQRRRGRGPGSPARHGRSRPGRGRRAGPSRRGGRCQHGPSRRRDSDSLGSAPGRPRHGRTATRCGRRREHGRRSRRDPAGASGRERERRDGRCPAGGRRGRQRGADERAHPADDRGAYRERGGCAGASRPRCRGHRRDRRNQEHRVDVGRG